MTASRSLEDYKQLAREVSQTTVIVPWEKDVRLGVPQEFVSELLEEAKAQDTLDEIRNANPKFKDAFDIVRSRQEPDKRRIIVYLDVLFDLKEKHAIANYLNDHHAPLDHKSWVVSKVSKNAYRIIFLTVSGQVQHWPGDAEISKKLRMIKPEYHGLNILYPLSNELLHDLRELVNQPQPSMRPRP